VSLGDSPAPLRFLIDNSLSPRVAVGLREAGHDAVHVRDYDLQGADDALVFDRAATESRIIVSADADFGTLLAQRQSPGPSVILLRRLFPRRAPERVALILATIRATATVLERGAVVVVEPRGIRVRELPIERRT